MGPSGPPGPAGPMGPSGSGIESFGYVYNLASIINATILGGSAINFSNNGPLEKITHAPGSDCVLINKTGTYKIDYSVFITAGVGASIAIAVNGVINPSTNIRALVTLGELNGTATLSLKKGDVITLVNNSIVAFTLALIPAVSAQLNIIQLNQCKSKEE
jgi:hypothetical protein